MSKIGIVMSSTRQGRFADRPAEWLRGIASKKHPEHTWEIVDLRDYPMPLFDEPMSPLRAPAKNEVAQRWAKKVAELDAFVFVTGEYNHSIPAALKNAIDYVYVEFNRKPAAFVGYGGIGGARAIEQLRLVLVEVQVAPLRHAVHITRDDYMGLVLHGKAFEDFPHLEQTAGPMLDDLLWWTAALTTARGVGQS